MDFTNKMSDRIGKELSFSSRKHSLSKLSGWGVALVVGLLAAPAIRGYWFPGEGEYGSASDSSTVTFAIRPKPESWSAPAKAEMDSAQVAERVPNIDPSNLKNPVPNVDPARLENPIQNVETQPMSREVPQPENIPEKPVSPSIRVVAPSQPVEPTPVAEPVGAAVASVIPSTGWVRIQSDPEGADVIVDGSFLGVTPINFEILSGNHELIVKKQGFDGVTRPLDVMAGVPLNLNMVLMAKEDHAKPDFPVLPKVVAVSPEVMAEAKVPVVTPNVIAETEVPDAKTAVQAEQPIDNSKPAWMANTAQDSPNVPQSREEEPASASEPLDFQYSIQVGSFSERNSAVKLAKALRDKGLDAFVYESWGKKDPTRLWNSVRVGRFEDLDSARAGLTQYKKTEEAPGAYVAFNEPSGKIIDLAPQGGEPALAKRIEKPVTVKVEGKDPPKQVVAAAPTTVAEPTAVVPEKIAPLLEENSEAAEQLFQQSMAFRNSRNLPQEELLLRQTLQKDPTHRFAQRRLARVLVESNRIPEGLDVLKEAIRGRSTGVLVGEDPNLAAFLAALYQQQGEHAKAIELYRSLLQRFPDKGIWRMGMAISLEKQGESRLALQAYEETLNSKGLSNKLYDFVQKRIQRLK